MNTQTVQTSTRLAQDDWSSSPNVYTACLSFANQLANGTLGRTVGVVIPAAAISVLLNTTSPVLASIQDTTRFEKRALTNPAIEYESGASNNSMEVKKITTVEEALAFLNSIRLSFSADSFDREEANARR